MPQFGQAGRVLVPVVDQDAAIAFYTTTLEFSVVPFGEDDRWVEVASPQGQHRPGRLTGIAPS